MPTVRRYGGRQMGLAALPGVRRTAALTETAAGVGLARAQGQRAEAVARVGAGVATDAFRLRQQEMEQADEIAVLEADTRLGQRANQRMFDPETGYLTVKGKAANALYDHAAADFDQDVKDIAATTLHTNRQRWLFKRSEARHADQLDTQLKRHVFQEQQEYEATVVKATVATAVESAIFNAQDPDRIRVELETATGVIRAAARARGWSPEVVHQKVADVHTAVHSGVIQRLLANGLDQKAKIYLEEAKDQEAIGGPALAELERQVGIASTAGTGLRTADQLWAQHAPAVGDDQTPIPLDAMEDAARQQFGNDPNTYDATVKYLRERTAGVEAARKDRQEARAGTLWSEVANGTTLEQIRTMPAFLSAPGKLQADVVQAVVREAEHQADRTYLQTERAYTAERRKEAEKERDGWAMAWHYDDPRVLSQMSPNQILALTPDLGVNHVNKLLEKQRQYAASADKVRDATIDSDQFNTLAEGAGLEPFKAKKTTDERAVLGRLRGTVEAAIDAEQRRKNGTLSREEKGALMTGILDRHVTLSTWGADPSVAAATVIHPTDQEKAYVPVAEIPDAALTQWVNVIRGRSASAQSKTRAEILAQWRDRIERAHAAAVLGLGADEELRRLLGR